MGQELKEFKNLDEAKMSKDTQHTAKKWLKRGDGVAVYENIALDSSGLGHRIFMSFGSKAAQLEMAVPPTRCPDIGNLIGWKYQLVGVVQKDNEECEG